MLKVTDLQAEFDLIQYVLYRTVDANTAHFSHLIFRDVDRIAEIRREGACHSEHRRAFTQLRTSWTAMAVPRIRNAKTGPASTSRDVSRLAFLLQRYCPSVEGNLVGTEDMEIDIRALMMDVE